MAEYIDKDKFMVILANIAKIKAKSEAQKSLMGRCMFCLDKMSAEDVIERSKIDKAIEEMENISQSAHLTRGDIKRMCIDILKRNVGE